MTRDREQISLLLQSPPPSPELRCLCLRGKGKVFVIFMVSDALQMTELWSSIISYYLICTKVTRDIAPFRFIQQSRVTHYYHPYSCLFTFSYSVMHGRESKYNNIE